ncbi:MAG: ATP-binding protein [Candidatus Eisenbacteria bacterium]|nr:ATP-binding protein [Candidatus Eisenbacteria bacterium]MCC7143354.1 ATP-binding protein [Candidatus Eisenbacteria bacterium]
MSTANPAPPPLPDWAQSLRDQFSAGASSQFLIHGNVGDLVETPRPDGSRDFLPLDQFLREVMFVGYDTVLQYDRGRGLRALKGAEEFTQWVTTYTGQNPATLAMTSLREPIKALELIDHYILRSLNLDAIRRAGANVTPPKLAVLIDYAQFILPNGDPLALAGDVASHLVKVLGWANDPSIHRHNIITLIVTERLNDLNALLTDNPDSAKIEIKLPTAAEARRYLDWLRDRQFPDLEARSDLSLEVLGTRLAGLSRDAIRNLISALLHSGGRISEQALSLRKKEKIERECQDLLEFVESPFTLDHVAGLEPVKAWLREDATLLRAGKSHALPMGYLICGRIGTGKTFIVTCWAGEMGIPCVVFKNFRDKWVGSTEGKLEKIFAVLRALGQVIVFVDEADQMTGKRDSGSNDSGLSGRIYAMLAKEMSNTQMRGKVIWVFATSRPDLVEVDLKRQGRLDVHIPLFPPRTQAEYHALLFSVARKLKFPIAEADLPELPEGSEFGGHEIEAMFVRALRVYELQGEPKQSLKEIFSRVAAEVRPNAHGKKLEYMDLVAVRECTDHRFLPERYASLGPEEIEARIEELRRFV